MHVHAGYSSRPLRVLALARASTGGAASNHHHCLIRPGRVSALGSSTRSWDWSPPTSLPVAGERRHDSKYPRLQHARRSHPDTRALQDGSASRTAHSGRRDRQGVRSTSKGGPERGQRARGRGRLVALIKNHHGRRVPARRESFRWRQRACEHDEQSLCARSQAPLALLARPSRRQHPNAASHICLLSFPASTFRTLSHTRHARQARRLRSMVRCRSHSE
jgi:hypothetical protein